MEIREVKFNLKVFIEEYVFAKEASDNEVMESLELIFEKEYKSSSLPIQEGIERFITKSKIAKEYSGLNQLVASCVENFKK